MENRTKNPLAEITRLVISNILNIILYSDYDYEHTTHPMFVYDYDLNLDLILMNEKKLRKQTIVIDIDH